MSTSDMDENHHSLSASLNGSPILFTYISYTYKKTSTDLIAIL